MMLRHIRSPSEESPLGQLDRRSEYHVLYECDIVLPRNKQLTKLIHVRILPKPNGSTPKASLRQLKEQLDCSPLARLDGLCQNLGNGTII